jgi:RHS repeat-associated protein
VDDQRVRKSVNGVVENYYLDGSQIAFVTDGSGDRTFHYLYGLNVDQVLAQDSPGGMVWALADRLGNIDTLTDAQGVVVDKRTFDSFGRVLSETNPSMSFRYGYTGRERDLESGLDYYRARYYDPNVGRFISVDPMGFGAGDTNLYRYVGNSSTNATDPSGEISWSDAQNYAYGGLENTDKFVAGFADKLTGGYTTKLRTEIYGDRVAGQHEGFAFNLGQSVGLATGLVTIGLATGGAGTIGGGLDLGVQLRQNQGDFSQVRLDSIAISAVGGKIGASVSGGLGKGGALVAGGAFAETGLGLGARTAINAGVGFNVGYWGKVAENAVRGEELTNGALNNGIFGGVGAAAGELAQAGAGKAWKSEGVQNILSKRNSSNGQILENTENGISNINIDRWSSSRTTSFNNEWKSLPGGVEIRKIGNYWIKRVNPNASKFERWWAKGSLDAQAEALKKLKDLSPSFIYKDNKLVIRDAGEYVPGNFWNTWFEGSKRLGTPFNDIRPRNIGANGIIFDPAKHPIQQSTELAGAFIIPGLTGYIIHDKLQDNNK